jgi:hypothetical protein
MVHRCANILAQEYLSFILMYIPLSNYSISIPSAISVSPFLYLPPHLISNFLTISASLSMAAIEK